MKILTTNSVTAKNALVIGYRPPIVLWVTGMYASCVLLLGVCEFWSISLFCNQNIGNIGIIGVARINILILFVFIYFLSLLIHLLRRTKFFWIVHILNSLVVMMANAFNIYSLHGFNLLSACAIIFTQAGSLWFWFAPSVKRWFSYVSASTS